MPCFRVAPGQLNRCSGHCCYGFVVGDNWSPSELQVMAYAQAKLPAWERNLEDIAQIADMVIPMGFIEPPLGASSKEAREATWRYTCKHLSDSGQCLNYANRPGMCRRYPYDEACGFVGCTMSAAAQEECRAAAKSDA